VLPVWFANAQCNRRTDSRLFCFPYAGASSVVYHNWAKSLPEFVDVIPVQLPGRGMHLNTAPLTRMDELIEQLSPVLAEFLDRPFFFFGHSMGALIAFELAHALRMRYRVEPEALFVSGREPPSFPERTPDIHRLPKDQFIAHLRLLNGTHPDLLGNEEILELILPVLRADFELVETYSFRRGVKLTCPIQAFGGSQDPEANPQTIRQWRNFTSGPFSMQVIEGDHFFIHQQKDQLLACLSKVLSNLRLPLANQMGSGNYRLLHHIGGAND
jgi:medium-chain acyl-[acyl-carrier-protein] hydrolase